MTEARIAVLEEKVAALEEDRDLYRREFRELHDDVKLLLQFANMGKGAGWLLIKGGSVVAAIIAAGWALLNYIYPHR